MRYALALSALLAAACATQSGRPEGWPRPEAAIRQHGNLFFGSGSTSPAFFDITVENPLNQPLTIRRVRIESPGMAQYGLVPTERVFAETIQPGGVGTVQITPTAVTTTSRPSEPLTVRVIIYYQAGERSFREIYMASASSGPY